MTLIKNIIFDLGGVLLNIDYSKTTNAFKELGFTDFENMYTMLKANNVFDGLETGHMTETDFYGYMLNAHKRARGGRGCRQKELLRGREAVLRTEEEDENRPQ